MKYLLLYPPGVTFSAGKERQYIAQIVPPLGLLYLARILEDAGHSAEIIDYSAQHIDVNELTDAIHRADAIGMTVLTPSNHNAIYVASLVRKIDPEKPFIIGGPHCSLYPTVSLEQLNADICVEGDGEENILDITKALKGKKSLSKIPGVHYKNAQNQIVSGPPAKPIENLDATPFPARHLVKKYRYGEVYKATIEKEKLTSIITSRGCPHRCRFCTRQYIGMKKYRVRSAENVISELKELSDQRYETIVISDDSFLSDVKRAYQIMDKIVAEGLHLEFFIQGARVDSADEALYQKMKDAGVKGISFGIESGNQDVLDYYHKHTTLAQIEKAIQLSRKMGFSTLGSFILGAPFETKEHLKQTIKFACSLPLDAVTFFALEYRAGSEIWEDAVAEGKIQRDEYTVSSDSRRGLGLLTKDELLRYCKKGHQQFYLRPSYIFDEFVQAFRKKDFSFMKAGARAGRHVLKDLL